MTEVYQFHTPRRLYGANSSGNGWAGGYAEPPTQDSSTALNTRPAWRGPARGRVRLKVLSGAAVAFVAIGVVMGFVHLGTRAANAIPLGNRLFAAVGLAQQPSLIRLDAVKASVVKTADGDVLMVEGSLLNERAKTIEAPNLRVSVRGGDRREIYVWIARPPKAVLAAGERVTFRTRLETPPANGETVWVRAARPGETPVPAEDRL